MNWTNVDGTTTYTYAWQRNALTQIGTGATYTVTAADLGQAVTCTKTASDSGGSTTSLPSLPATPTAALAPVNVTPPSITGTAQQGQTVTCSTQPGDWLNSPTGYTYSWQRNVTTTISTGQTYTLTGADVNQAITCQVVASNSGGMSLPATSLPIIPGAPAAGTIPVLEAPPAISGTAAQGQTVTCSPGTWTNSPTSFTYSWQRNVATAIGATSTYTLTAADVNAAITCMVVAHNASGDSLPAISLPMVPVAASSNGGSSGGTTGGNTGGNSGGNTGGNTGGGGGGGGKVHAPTLRSFSVTPHTVIVLVRGKHRTTKGTTFQYALDSRAGLLIEIQQHLAGRLQGGHCVAATARNRKARSCTRWVTVKLLKVTSAKAGTSRLQFAGRIGAHLVAVGTYRAYAAAVNAGGWSKVRSVSFVVKSKLVAPHRPRRPSHHRH